MRKFRKAFYRARIVFMATMFGECKHSAWDGTANYAVYSYKDMLVHVPTVPAYTIKDFYEDNKPDVTHRFVRSEDIRPGITVYEKSNGRVTKIDVLSEPYQHKDIGVFADCKGRYGPDKDTRVERFSLSDAGIIDNHYNNHRTFFSKEEAEAYNP